VEAGSWPNKLPDTKRHTKTAKIERKKALDTPFWRRLSI
jgi:hypothetical protein